MNKPSPKDTCPSMLRKNRCHILFKHLKDILKIWSALLLFIFIHFVLIFFPTYCSRLLTVYGNESNTSVLLQETGFQVSLSKVKDLNVIFENYF